MKPINAINAILSQSAISHRQPSLGLRWLVTLANQNGRERVVLLDLRTKRVLSLPGLNRSDAQPLSASVSANGERIALIRERNGQAEVLIYGRKFGTAQAIKISPRGIPVQVSLDGPGRVLAVQVNRDGRWDIDLIRL